MYRKKKVMCSQFCEWTAVLNEMWHQHRTPSMSGTLQNISPQLDLNGRRKYSDFDHCRIPVNLVCKCVARVLRGTSNTKVVVRIRLRVGSEQDGAVAHTRYYSTVFMATSRMPRRTSKAHA